MNRNLTNYEISMLAGVERQMDAGEIAFVIWGGNRLTVQPMVMGELSLETGQTVSDTIAGAILEGNLAVAQANMALARI